MQPESPVEDRAGKPASLYKCPTAQRLSRRSIHSEPISILPRILEPAILTALDAVEPAQLPRLRLTGSVEQLRGALDGALREIDFGPKWLAEWLSADVIFLARLFEELTKTRRLRLRLESVEDDACRKFHTDNVHFRLVTTYRGPGTEWVPPSLLATSQESATFPTGSIRSLDRGQVAIIRGAREATAERPGLLHRSPPIAGTGVTRLFLAIDDGADRER